MTRRNVNSPKIVLGKDGRMLIPARLRTQLGWLPGDKLIVSKGASNSLRVISLVDHIGELRGLFKDKSGRSLATELIEERRRAAASEL